MLRFLSIRHLAVIDRLELEFQPGLNVLTGETGAGKSILVGAVGMLAGGRASSDLVRTGEDLAVIEAVFDTPDGRELIVRREVTSQGRSRAFLGGALVTSAALRDAAGPLVDLVGQHEHQVLLDPVSHLDVLDAFAGVTAERKATAEAFADWGRAREARDRLAALQRQTAERREFLEFQLGEIRRAAPKTGEDEELEGTRTVLANADRLQRLCGDAYHALYEGEQAALPALGLVWRKVSDLAAIDERFRPYAAARDGIKSQLEDLAYFLRSYAAGIDASPSRLQEIEDRLAALERLKKKYGPTLHEVIDRAQRMDDDLCVLDTASERMQALEAELGRARERYGSAAMMLRERRRASATPFCAALERSLADLAMARTRCAVRFADAQDEAGWSERGMEIAELYISPNPGEDVRPLARIASGGELSRIMLALKILAGLDAPGRTLIFDEVDAGIGGAAADVVGARLAELAGRCQVLCITHLPQIAAHGTTHFAISKTVKAGRTLTTVSRLTVTEREEELARMIGGSEISGALLAGAREMLAARRKDRRDLSRVSEVGDSSGARREAKGETKAKGESESRSRKS